MILSFCEGDLVSLSLAHFNLFFGGFSSVMRWCSQRMIHSVHLKMIFSHARTLFYFHSRRTIRRVVSVCLCCVRVCFRFSSKNRNYNDSTNELLSSLMLTNARSRASCSPLTLSRSRSLVVTTLVLCSFCFFF